MLFAATSINYVDRQIIGVLKPTLQLEFGWSESSYGDVVFWFQAAYALGYLGFGRATLQTRRNVVRVGAPASHGYGMSEMLIVTYVTVP